MYPTKALIVVDMQSDFVDPNGKLSIVPALGREETKKLIKDIADFTFGFEGRVFYTLDTHNADSCEFDSFPEHCIKGTEGHDLTYEVAKALTLREQKYRRTAPSLEKSSFTGSTLIDFLAQTYPDVEFTIVGVCTHICVHDVAASLVNKFKEKYNKIPKIIIPKHLTGDFDQEMAGFALKRLSNLYGVEVK